jgi:hypothetical protein
LGCPAVGASTGSSCAVKKETPTIVARHPVI